MGCNPPYHLSYRLRLLLLFTLCLTVVGWATSNYFVGAIQVIPKAKDFMASFHKVIHLGNEETLGHDGATKKPELANCPSVSPNLRGQSKLVFKPDLTLEEIEAENPKVSRGRYHPEECKALQRVAILIPHRNREKTMKISRPKPDVGKYTMIFHTRDKGNEVNMGRMKLLQQMSRVWKTDGLSSCSYRLLSVEHNPLYANITVDFWTAA